jgi:hypothetical protein
MARVVTLISVVAGGMLLFAALLKVNSSHAITAYELFLSFGEFALGGLLIAFPTNRYIRGATLVLFLMFFAASLKRISEGFSTCGCFGDIKISPATTAAIDFLIAVCVSIGLIMNRLVEQHRAKEPSKLSTGTRWSLIALGIAFAVLNIERFGRESNRIVRVDPPSIELGKGLVGEFATHKVTLRNSHNVVIRAISGSPACSCDVDCEFPIEIPARDSVSFDIRVPFKGTPGRFQRQFEFYLDHPVQTRVLLELSGSVQDL